MDVSVPYGLQRAGVPALGWQAIMIGVPGQKLSSSTQLRTQAPGQQYPPLMAEHAGFVGGAEQDSVKVPPQLLLPV